MSSEYPLAESNSAGEYPFSGPIFAYTTNQHLILDVDNTNIHRLRRVIPYIQRLAKAGDCLLVQSSYKTVQTVSKWKRFILFLKYWVLFWVKHEESMNGLTELSNQEKWLGNYHLIFDNKMPWEEIKSVIGILHRAGMVDERFWRLRQTGLDLTVRISEKWYRRPTYNRSMSGRILKRLFFQNIEKGVKPKPWIVEYISHKSNKCDDMISDYVIQAGLTNEFALKVMHLPIVTLDSSAINVHLPPCARGILMHIFEMEGKGNVLQD